MSLPQGEYLYFECGDSPGLWSLAYTGLKTVYYEESSILSGEMRKSRSRSELRVWCNVFFPLLELPWLACSVIKWFSNTFRVFINLGPLLFSNFCPHPSHRTTLYWRTESTNQSKPIDQNNTNVFLTLQLHILTRFKLKNWSWQFCSPKLSKYISCLDWIFSMN